MSQLRTIWAGKKSHLPLANKQPAVACFPYNPMAEIQEILADKVKVWELTKEVFDEVDTDHSGQIEADELKAMLVKIAKDAEMPPPSQSDVDGVLKALDSDGNGTISLSEFQVLIYEVLVALSSQ